MNNFSRIGGHVTSPFQLYGGPLEKAGSEIIPDSEEERQGKARQELRLPISTQVIEISSDESTDDEGCTSITMSPTKPSVALPQTPNKSRKKTYNGFRRVVQSSDESEIEIVAVATDNAIETTYLAQTTFKSKAAARERSPSPKGASSESTDDDGIIIFDEPKSAANPFRLGKGNAYLKPRVRTGIHEEDNVTLPSRSSATPTPGPSVSILTPPLRRRGAKAGPSTPRSNSEKAKLLERRERLHAYAEELFYELNKTVFKGGLPTTTKLNWNNRLLKTAGRAKFHRSRLGVQTVEIELAEKILDSEERIRNTLSHEMCHLATWVIDQKINEHHGNIFKKWANQVMKKYPHIQVSVQHNYEISYPFEWKCEKCAKIYGRFSKSIRPDECVCGACKEGKLIPLFNTKRAFNTPKISKFASSNAQESPHAVQGATSVGTNADTESAIDVLTNTLAVTSIAL